MKYFPMFRGKQNEMLALESLAEDIAQSGRIVPIVEPVNWNATTSRSISTFMDSNLKFVLICNPSNGNFSSDHIALANHIDRRNLLTHYNWVPALYVHDSTGAPEIRRFLGTYGAFQVAFVYYGRPQQQAAITLISQANVAHHVFMVNRVEQTYIQTIPIADQVLIQDRFVRAVRNAEYPDREFFTDMNTAAGNPTNVNFGDFSIVGDHFTQTGGAAHAVALHHIHFCRNSHRLRVSHFKSDRRQTPVDPGGKALEALGHLVRDLPQLRPSNTTACDEYRELNANQTFRGLGYMKRLAIKHHLEVMLSGDGLGR